MEKLSFAALPRFLLVVLLPLSLVIAIIFVVVYPNDLRLQSLLATGCRPTDSSRSPAAFAGDVTAVAPEPDLRVLLGVLTVPDAYARRSLVRHAYLLQQPSLPSSALVDVRFVLCNLTTEAQRVLVAMEIMLYGDVIVLDCAENLNGGKTYTYFSTLPGALPRPYDYVVKTDDDTYYRLENLAAELRAAPREDLYMGLQVPCSRDVGNGEGFMSGMGYVLSWDLVEWVSRSETARKRMAGPEDIMTGAWLNGAGRGRNRVHLKPRMYDYLEGSENCFRHGFIPETIAVHKLKNEVKWAKTLRYFNVTAGLKPSKLYHVD